MSRFDYVYRKLLLTRFFTKGWGTPENLKRLFEFRKIISNRDLCRNLVQSDYPIYIDKEEEQKDCKLIEGHFESPLLEYLPGIMPEEVKIARFQMILPKVWKKKTKPVCLHLAGTGDHYFWRRRSLLAKPLLKEAGIASIILENPYYGCRKPKKQLRSSLHNVSDLFVMGGALILESLALFHWCERQGYGPLGITGVSMGGYMASIAATNWHKPLSLIPCLSWSTASCVFTQGVMSGAIPWSLLQKQYFSDDIYGKELSKLINSPETDTAFLLGQDFAKSYPESVSDYEKFHKDLVNHSSSSTDLKKELVVNSSTSKLARSNLMFIGDVKMADKEPGKDLLLSNVPPMTKFHTSAPASNKYTNDNKYFFQELLDGAIGQRRKTNSQPKEAWHFMCGAMDECTHLGNFSKPVDTNLIIAVVAKMDAYVPRDAVVSLEELWPGMEVRSIDSGHIAAILFRQHVFRKAIIDAFDRQTKAYFS